MEPNISENLFDPIPPPAISGNLALELPPHTHVITWGNSAWPAWSNDEYIIVDLRLFEPLDFSSEPEMIFRPEALARAGVPDPVILDAAESNPPGFAMFRR